MSEYKPTYVLKILHLIHYQLSASELVEIGLNYSQVADLIADVIQKGLVENTEDKGLILTNSGLELLDKLSKELYPSNKNIWMLPSEENRGPKIDKFDIYLPRKQREE